MGFDALLDSIYGDLVRRARMLIGAGRETRRSGFYEPSDLANDVAVRLKERAATHLAELPRERTALLAYASRSMKHRWIDLVRGERREIASEHVERAADDGLPSPLDLPEAEQATAREDARVLAELPAAERQFVTLCRAGRATAEALATSGLELAADDDPEAARSAILGRVTDRVQERVFALTHGECLDPHPPEKRRFVLLCIGGSAGIDACRESGFAGDNRKTDAPMSAARASQLKREALIAHFLCLTRDAERVADHEARQRRALARHNHMAGSSDLLDADADALTPAEERLVALCDAGRPAADAAREAGLDSPAPEELVAELRRRQGQEAARRRFVALVAFFDDRDAEEARRDAGWSGDAEPAARRARELARTLCLDAALRGKARDFVARILAGADPERARRESGFAPPGQQAAVPAAELAERYLARFHRAWCTRAFSWRKRLFLALCAEGMEAADALRRSHFDAEPEGRTADPATVLRAIASGVDDCVARRAQEHAA